MSGRNAWANRPFGDLPVTAGSPQGTHWDTLRVEPVLPESAPAGEPSRHVIQHAIRRVG